MNAEKKLSPRLAHVSKIPSPTELALFAKALGRESILGTNAGSRTDAGSDLYEILDLWQIWEGAIETTLGEIECDIQTEALKDYEAMRPGVYTSLDGCLRRSGAKSMKTLKGWFISVCEQTPLYRKDRAEKAWSSIIEAEKMKTWILERCIRERNRRRRHRAIAGALALHGGKKIVRKK